MTARPVIRSIRTTAAGARHRKILATVIHRATETVDLEPGRVGWAWAACGIRFDVVSTTDATFLPAPRDLPVTCSRCLRTKAVRAEDDTPSS